MSRQLVPAFAKINLCLFLGDPRQDGRHELVTLFESVGLCDELRIATTEAPGEDQVLCPGVSGPNLVTQALAGLRAAGWGAPPVRVEIAKRIPVAAGMGGGSADAAALLRLAAELAPIPPAAVSQIAAQLGADVPSQLAPGPSLGTGAGNMVQPVAALAEHGILVLPQPLALSTAEVYREADRLGLPRRVGELSSLRAELTCALRSSSLGVGLPRRLLVNDLQPASLSLCPAIAPALELATAAGADPAIVCGSGPTVIGLYWGLDGLDRARAAARGLREQFAGATAVGPVRPAAPVAQAPAPAPRGRESDGSAACHRRLPAQFRFDQ